MIECTILKDGRSIIKRWYEKSKSSLYFQSTRLAQHFLCTYYVDCSLSDCGSTTACTSEASFKKEKKLQALYLGVLWVPSSLGCGRLPSWTVAQRVRGVGLRPSHAPGWVFSLRGQQWGQSRAETSPGPVQKETRKKSVHNSKATSDRWASESVMTRSTADHRHKVHRLD